MNNVHGHLHNNEHRNVGVRPVHCKLLALEDVDYAPIGFDEFVGFSPFTRMIFGMKEADHGQVEQ